MRTPLVLAISVSLLVVGCGLGGQSKPARAQDTALELNLNARFGRLELAVEHVADTNRNAFMEKRRAWGSSIRIADYDMTGLAMKGEDDCETQVRVAWFRASENDLRSTTIKQKWHDFKGDWKLTDESRLDGDSGLLGEPPVASTEASTSGASAGARRAQFPTITLGTGNTSSLGVSDVPPAAAVPPPTLADPSAEAPR